MEEEGNSVFSPGDFATAIEHFTEAIDLSPTNHVLYSNRSAAHASFHQYAEALSDAKKTVDLKPDWAKGYSHLGAAHLGLNQSQEAVSAYNKGLQIDLTNEELKSGLAYAKKKAGSRSRSSAANRSFGDAFQEPEMWAKLTTDPSTREFLRQPDFVNMMEEIQRNLQDQRVMQSVAVLLNLRPPGGEEEEAQSLIVANRFPIPDDLIISSLARVRISSYLKLSLVHPQFRDFITSPDLYQTRMSIGNLETLLYAFVSVSPYDRQSGYILRETNGSLILSRIKELSNLPYGSAVVTVGCHMYMIGGSFGSVWTPAMYMIDCYIHKFRKLKPMRRARRRAAAVVVDGKIFVIGGCKNRETYMDCHWIEVYDLKSETWTSLECPYAAALSSDIAVSAFVMDDKIYIKHVSCCITYAPKDNQWELLWTGVNDDTVCTWVEVLRDLWGLWSCVIDGILFMIDPGRTLESVIVAFDPEEKKWMPVKLVSPMPNSAVFYFDSQIANLGGNLVVLGSCDSCNCSRLVNDEKESWCTKIDLKRNKDGEFEGTVVSVERVFKSSAEYHVDDTLVVSL